MIRTAVSAICGLAVVAGTIALLTYIRVAAPDTWLFEVFAAAQLVILGAVGFGFIEDAAEQIKKRLGSAYEKRRPRERR